MNTYKRLSNYRWAAGLGIVAVLLLMPEKALAAGALSGGGGSGLPFEQGVGVIWNSISQFVAPIAVALGVIIGIILFARGSAGAAIYTLFGFALIGGVALGITEIFNVFGWDGAVIPVEETVSASLGLILQVLS